MASLTPDQPQQETGGFFSIGTRVLGVLAGILAITGLGVVAKSLVKGGMAALTSSATSMVAVGLLGAAAVATVGAISFNFLAACHEHNPSVSTERNLVLDDGISTELQVSKAKAFFEQDHEQNRRADGRSWVAVVRPGRQQSVGPQQPGQAS
jgi:hypothetical protein